MAARVNHFVVSVGVVGVLLSGWLVFQPRIVEAARNCVPIITAGPGYEVCLTTTLTGNISGPGPKTAGIVASADAFLFGSPLGQPGSFGMPGSTNFYINEFWYHSDGVNGGAYGPNPIPAGNYTNRVRWEGLWGGQWFRIDNIDSFVVPLDPPAVPAAPSVSPNPSTEGDTLTFSWNAVSGATSYVVGTDSGPCAFDTCFPGAATSMTSGGYVAGSRWVRVQACNASCSAPSAQTGFTVRQGLGVPQNVRVTPATQRHGDTGTISWDSVPGATYYKVFNTWGQCGGVCDWAAQPGPSQTIVGANTHIGPGNHAVWVKACDAASCGNSTNQVTFTILSNDAAFVSQDVPGTVLPGETFTATVTFRNTGQSTWDTPGQYVLRSEVGFGSFEVALPAAVAPNQSVTFSGSLSIASPGIYPYRFRMYRKENDFGFFGQSGPDSTIRVVGPVGAEPIRVKLQIKARQHLPLQ